MDNSIHTLGDHFLHVPQRFQLRGLFAATLMSLLSSNAFAGDTSGNLSLSSQYRGWDGSVISNTPHIQGDITYTFEDGINAGVWGSKDLSGKDGDEINYHIGYNKELGDFTVGGRLILADAPHVGKFVDVVSYYGYLQSGDTTISTLVEDSQIGGKTGWGLLLKHDIVDNVSLILQSGEHKFDGDNYGLVRFAVSNEIFDNAKFSIEPQYKEGGKDEGFGIMGKLTTNF